MKLPCNLTGVQLAHLPTYEAEPSGVDCPWNWLGLGRGTPLTSSTIS